MQQSIYFKFVSLELLRTELLHDQGTSCASHRIGPSPLALRQELVCRYPKAKCHLPSAQSPTFVKQAILYSQNRRVHFKSSSASFNPQTSICNSRWPSFDLQSSSRLQIWISPRFPAAVTALLVFVSAQSFIINQPCRGTITRTSMVGFTPAMALETTAMEIARETVMEEDG